MPAPLVTDNVGVAASLLIPLTGGMKATPMTLASTHERTRLERAVGRRGSKFPRLERYRGPWYPEPVPVGSALAPGDGPGRGGPALPAWDIQEDRAMARE